MRLSGVAIFFIESLAFCSAFNADRESSSLVARAIGDSCNAPLGKGSCQNTGNCQGISYPDNFCPRDPNDVQVSHTDDPPIQKFESILILGEWNSAVSR
jgi:hypothetical protein